MALPIYGSDLSSLELSNWGILTTQTNDNGCMIENFTFSPKDVSPTPSQWTCDIGMESQCVSHNKRVGNAVSKCC